ncbi:MAG: hypothetical protein JRM80_07710 [Nitrososphaerota archaeon]|nr:hypothetical protein [Nitrososphaerota archaeon]
MLVEEHVIMKDGLRRVKEATERRDFRSASLVLKELDMIFRQHIADEEFQILGLLIERLGVEGAAEEIKIFQQHRPIYQLMKRVTELAATPAIELEAVQAELTTLLDRHTAAEERQVFPKATSLRQKS